MARKKESQRSGRYPAGEADHSPNGDLERYPPVTEIPRAAVGRLSLYLRELQRLAAEERQHVSSRRLGELLGVSDAVVRRDLGHLRPAGRRGVGYTIAPLMIKIRQTLGGDVEWRVALVGAGSLGHALLRYKGFEHQRFHFVAAFDIDPGRIGTEIGGVPVRDVERLEQEIRDQRITLAILCAPAAVAGSLAKRLSRAGIAGILNFAPVVLQTGTETCITNVDLASELQQLAFSVLIQNEPTGPLSDS